ncbi:hypothetical protein ART_4037 [Arthrobacter sp. PAMC 25486]|nr:hypothetical protein ART_4037 [Arthrobacter sp. PAMC 25486]
MLGVDGIYFMPTVSPVREFSQIYCVVTDIVVVREIDNGDI